ncbi:hypothetical protein JXM83_07505 [Candidatus Woesearchaeota archaeon]|nr:hypothetical protein [Candidatus Woesearchaeota archaeon]
MASVFRGTIEFFAKLGIFDVILPFLLVYTITYAILQKTKTLAGFDKDKKPSDTKAVDAVISFCIAFFVVASTKLVAIISQSIANIALVIIILFCFILLASMLYTNPDKPFELSDGMKKALVIVVMVVVLAIFFYYIGWLTVIINFLGKNWNTEAVTSIIMMILFIGLIAWVSGSGGKKPEGGK